MARLNPSRPPPPSSRTKKTIFSSSSESEPASTNSDSDSEFPDIAALPPSPRKKTATRKRAFPPTDTDSTTSNQGQTVVESATSPNAASSSVTSGVKRRKLLLGATFSDNVLFQKWTPTEEDAVLPARRKKKRVLNANINNNPFGLGRVPLGMRHGGDEVSYMDSEAENPVVRRRKNVKVKEVKRVQGESTSTVTTGKAEVGRTTEESLFSGRRSVSEERGKATSRDMTNKSKEKQKEDKKEKPPASAVQPSEQVTNKSNDMMEIDDDKEDEMDIFEDLEDYAEASFHTACSMEISESEDGRTLKTTALGKGQNANTAVAVAASNSKDDDDSDEDLDNFFTRLSDKPKVPVVRESHLSLTKPRATKNSRGKRLDATRESQKSRTLFDEEEEESDERGSARARATKRKTASSDEDEDEDEDEDTCGEDVTQDFSCLQLESSSSPSSSDPEEGSETETKTKRRSRPPATTAARKRTRTPSPSPPKLVPKLKPKTTATLPPSPKKLPRIPTTPHRPSSDLFWSREFVDDWNDEHSPVKKDLFPSDSSRTNIKPPADSPVKKRARAPPSPQKLAAAQARESRLLRQSFDTYKNSLAVTFLALLDTRLTSGRLAALTASTGGIKLTWSKTLNTTAGRANWKKESIATGLPSSMSFKHDGNEGEKKEEKKEVKHHASIELATKVLSTPERLFNTLAHEFCHLAVFMIDGVTTRPHGREFKCWAGRVNESEFGRRRGEPLGKLVVTKEGEGEGETKEEGKWEGGYAVEVTTRHGYEIEFRYVWVCDGPAGLSSSSSGQKGAAGSGEGKGKEGKEEKGGENKKGGGGCGTEYKRHSKSVDPSRHRCGVCKGVLKQVKPAPRGQQQAGSNLPSSSGSGANGEGSQGGMGMGMGTNKIKEKAKQSEYQVFVKEQMKVVKAQKPGLAFGEVMKEVAERWKVEKARRDTDKKEKEKEKASPPTEVVGRKFSTLLEEVIADEDEDDDSAESPDVFEDEPMMDVVDLTADD